MNTLSKIRQIVTGNTHRKYPEAFNEFLIKSTIPITKQALDLRSAISKQACLTIELMAEILGNLFQQAAERYLHENCLLKLVLSGNKIMAQAGHNAVLCILQHVTSPKLLIKVVDVITRKNPVLRNKCSAYLQCILTYFPITIIEKYADNVENAISIAVNDACADTRTIGRECYNLYEDLFPAKAKRLYDTLPNAVQKAISSKELNTIPKSINKRHNKDLRMQLVRERHNSYKENIILDKEITRQGNNSLATTLGQSTPHNKTLDHSFDSVNKAVGQNVYEAKDLSINEMIELVGDGKGLSEVEFAGTMSVLIDSMSSSQLEVFTSVNVDHTEYPSGHL